MDDNKNLDAASDDNISVVGVGASAGGVQALKAFFEYLPATPGAAFVVIVHLEPDTRSELPEILALRSHMPVRQVTGTVALTQNCIYVIPPDRELRISDHEISATPFTEPRGHRAPIDFFFRSLAQHGDGFAVVLTGAGSDGAAGAKAIKEAGGIVFVQSPEEAEYPSMPRSAIATEAADFVLTIKEIAQQLVDILATKKHVASAQKLGDEEEQIRRLLAHVRVRTGHDFTHYKRSTVMRRILRRMQVSRKETLDEYFAYLRDNAEESQALLADLLISVTTFFRDSKAFESLAKLVIPRLFENKNHDSIIRVWVPGCATGEEAYSIAILLLEEAGRHDIKPEIQVFGSDMDARALAIAREGRYPVAIEADLSEERLRRFFTREGEHYRVKRELRDVLLFANHSLLKDPPFSRLDLISCRNLLIYLDRDLQQQVLTTLHYGLIPDGYLFLGSSESAESPDGLFRTVDRDGRIFQSAGRHADGLPVLPRLAGTGHAVEPQRSIASTLPTPLRAAQTAHRDALELQAPPSILIDSNFRVIHLSETAGHYLQPSAGPLTSDIIDLVRQELRFELRGALHRAFEQNAPALTIAVPVRFNGTPVAVYAQVRPQAEPGDEKPAKRALIFFLEGEPQTLLSPEIGQGTQPVDNQIVQRLRHELDLAQTRLRTLREESEAANEELRAANEELQSINEEYRSTAEELETSKEELQSINEKLQTVNSELKLKLETVSRANSDLQNLMAATDLATLFLDPGLRIKRFTPKLTDIFSITPNDVGRPITDFTHQLQYDGLPSDVHNVLDNLVPIEREVTSRKGGWYLVRFRPYRTVDDKIDGIVATFLDVTERRRMEDALRTSEQNFRQETRLVELSHTPIFVWQFDGPITQWNRGSEALYGYTKNEAVGQIKERLLKTKVPGSSFQAIKDALLKQGSWKGEVIHTTKDGRRLTVESQIELSGVGEHRLALESTHDVTQTKMFEQRMHLLLRELTHRVKNTLTVMQSIVRQTWRFNRGEDFIERLEGRLGALANAHRLLVDTDWQGADLNGLIQSQVGSYVAGNPSRLRLKGPNVRLSSSVATPFGMILHELATNAAKYGALSVDAGHVELSWEMLDGNTSPVLRVVWQEFGGPPVKKPKSQGFGSRLIDSGLQGAKVDHEFLPDGVRCTLEVPLDGADGDGDGADK